MAPGGRLRGRSDAIMFGGCIALALLLRGLSDTPRDAIASGLRSTVVAPLVGMQRGSETWRRAWLDRDERLLARDSAAMLAVAARAITTENEQLRAIIGLGQRLKVGFIPAEALQPPMNQAFVETVVLTAGSNAGVRKNSPVVAPEGLVGKVVSADPTMSIAVLYTHPDFRASGMTADGKDFGIVYPHLPQGIGGRDRQYLLEFRHVPYRSKLKPGTLIVTIDLGGTFPAGVAIGTVLRELSASAGLSRSYLLQPAVIPSRLSAVMILDPQRSTQGVGNIWTSGISTDSATQKIVEAGDSLVRETALLVARARNAVMDSVRRAASDSIRRLLGLPVDSAAADSVAKARAAAAQAIVPRAIPGSAAGGLRGPGRVRRDSLRADSLARGLIRPDTLRSRPDTGAVRPPRGP